MLTLILYACVFGPLLVLAVVSLLIWKKAREIGTFPVPEPSLSSFIFISGCDTGIGRTIALRMASQGFHVLAGVYDEKSGEGLINEAKGTLTPIPLDITKPEVVAKAVQQVTEIVEKEKGKVVGLVNNAGIAVYGPLEYITPERMQLQMNVNLIGHTTVTSLMLPLLRASKGRVVNTVSIAGRICSQLMGPYCASKFGMEAITNCQRMELAHFGISVSAIEPGFIRTPLVENVSRDFEQMWESFPEESRTLYKTQYKQGQLGADFVLSKAPSPEIVADAMQHALTSPTPKTRYLVGTDARVYALAVWLLPDRWLDVVVSFLQSKTPKVKK